MNIRFIVNKIEGKNVVCEKEDGTFFDKEMNELPFGIKIGDCLTQVDNVICVDRRATKELKESNQQLMAV